MVGIVENQADTLLCTLASVKLHMDADFFILLQKKVATNF